ncbi:MAG: hypothetical protein Unbinned8622contig1005_60 [Prokaryotic dsDNA virus sp.]|nr:MAG: hypothetical protein Unbinned8622contig1005_60 [Prokaryotic dsDNA virus sp.]
MKWVKHDTDSHRDARLRKLVLAYGMEGFGLYWYCIELIAGDVSSDKYTFELEHDAEIISHDTGISVTKVNEMMAFMVDLRLFENDGGVITCMKIAKRLDSSMTSNPEMRKLISRLKDVGDADSHKSHDPVMIESCKTRSEKTSKEDKGSKSKRFVPPSLEEIADVCRERGYLFVDPESFFHFYESKNWMVGRSKMSNWVQAAAGWNAREKKRQRGNKQVEYIV